MKGTESSQNKTMNKYILDKEFELWVLFDHTREALARARELELAYYNLTIEQAVVLQVLSVENGVSTYARMADISHRQYNSVTTLVNRMIKQGLVKKKKERGNRQYTISITEKGIAQYKPVAINSIKMTFSMLSESDKKALTKYLHVLQNKAHEMVGFKRKLAFLPE